MNESKRYHERAATALRQARRLVDAAEADHLGWTKYRERRFRELQAEFREHIDKRNRHAREEPIVGPRAFIDEYRVETRDGGTMGNDDEVRTEYGVRVNKDWTGRQVFNDYLAGRVSDDEYRSRFEVRAAAQSVGSSAAGGILAPRGLANEIFQIQKAFNGMRRTRARIFRTDHGREMAVPGLDDTSNKAKIVSEGSSGSGSTNLSFTQIVLEATMYQVDPVLASIEVIQDSEFDLVGLIRDKFAERYGRATEEHFATRSSTETNGPHGLVNSSTGAVKVVAGTTTLTMQKLRDLFFSVDPAWRDRAEWAMSDGALQRVLDLEDSQGRPLVEPNLQAGAPQMLLGKPVRIVNSLQDFSSAGQKPIFFGDMSAFAIRDVRDLEIVIYRERFMPKRQLGYQVFARTDSRPLYSSTYSAARRPIRCIVTTTG